MHGYMVRFCLRGCFYPPHVRLHRLRRRPISTSTLLIYIYIYSRTHVPTSYVCSTDLSNHLSAHAKYGRVSCRQPTRRTKYL